MNPDLITSFNISFAAALIGASVGVLICNTLHSDFQSNLERYPTWLALLIVRSLTLVELFVGAFVTVAYSQYVLSPDNIIVAAVAVVFWLIFMWGGFAYAYNEKFKHQDI